VGAGEQQTKVGFVQVGSRVIGHKLVKDLGRLWAVKRLLQIIAT
jgi:hypothetical protein